MSFYDGALTAVNCLGICWVRLLEKTVTSQNAPGIRARIGAFGANRPTTPEADEIFYDPPAVPHCSMGRVCTPS